eukprot:CAMPEP_0115044992 /NCGR_PEP_ID=MMETSP0216-20121206/47866_1 /TAXON_ID=223996 /ORGANISM="Protocruzia adherens, Strain Boccale" /LENGTH=559 /DNA_ID=CAMNT_0002427753 /DNA_START=23 /DNA_END=1698 /DNA_ORIENTATION=+
MSNQPARMVETDGTIKTFDGGTSMNRLNDDGDIEFEEANSTLMNNPNSILAEEVDVANSTDINEDSRARLILRYIVAHFLFFVTIFLVVPFSVGCEVFFILFSLWWLATTVIEYFASRKMRPSSVAMMTKYGNSDSIKSKLQADIRYYTIQKIQETLHELSLLFIIITLLLIWDSDENAFGSIELALKVLSIFSFGAIICFRFMGFVNLATLFCSNRGPSSQIDFLTMLACYHKSSLLYVTGFKNFQLVEWEQVKFNTFEYIAGESMFFLLQVIYAARSSCNSGVMTVGIILNIVNIVVMSTYLTHGYMKSRSYFLCRKKFQSPFIRINQQEFDQYGDVFYLFLKTTRVYSVMDFSDTNLQSSDIQKISSCCNDNIIEIHMDSSHKLELGALDTLLSLLKRFPKLRCIYFGERRAFVKEGVGRGYFKNGDSYEGVWRRDIIDGRGKLHFSNGSYYEGALDKGVISGYGKLYRTDGSIKYEGDWARGKRNGIGNSFFTNGHKYEGEWREDIMDGSGRLTFPNGDILEGIWKDGHITGKAVRHYTDQSKFEGQFVDGEING